MPRAPLARALVFSLGLHLALLAVVELGPAKEVDPGVVLEVRIEGTRRSAPGRAGFAPRAEATPEPIQTAQPSGRAVQRPDLSDAVQATPASLTPDGQSHVPVGVEKGAVANTAGVPFLLDTHWYGAREVDAHPRALSRIEPVYPPQARRRGQEGAVKLRLRIDEFGRVSEAEVVEGDPPGVFDAAVLDAVRAAQFVPAKKNGSPVRYDGHYRFVFSLD